MLIGLAAITVFNLTDTFFISLLGTTELAAISFTFPVVVLIAGLTLGLGVGVTAIISQQIGKGNHSEVKRLTRDGLILALSIVVLICTVGLLTMNLTFEIMGASDEILPLVKDYMQIWYFGVAFVIIPMVGNSAIRGTGNVAFPAAIMVFAALTNFVLDPLLIFGLGPFPQLGLKGAAIATVIARGTTMALSLWVLIKREKLLSLKVPRVSELFRHWKSILVVGGPAGLTNVITPIAVGVITKLVSSHGVGAVAALGAAARVEQLTMMIPAALGSGLAPFIGQNWGAGKVERVRNAITLSQRFLFFGGVLIYFLIVFWGEDISQIFTKDPVVSTIMVTIFKIVFIGIALDALFIISTSSFNALRRPKQALLLHFYRIFIFQLPFAYLGSMLWGLEGIFWGVAATKICSGIMGYFRINKAGKVMVLESS